MRMSDHYKDLCSGEQQRLAPFALTFFFADQIIQKSAPTYDDPNGMHIPYSRFRMAPEMVTSKAYGAKVDIWSFGCLVLEMFTGQQPWKGYAPQQALFTVR